MNGILALGHFCETHGPSVIICTQSLAELHTQQPPHILTVPWCEACKSVELNHAYISKYNESSTYVTVRTALKQEIAFLLKQACVRSLSCEEQTGKEGGTVYFGDSERGHVLSYTFRLPDSLARGFHRLFTIILLMKDKVHLLNSWPFVTTHLKKLINHLKTHASEINTQEQNECSQRALRVSTGTSVSRSLVQLTGIPNVFSQIHLWFTWILIAASKETIEYQVMPALGVGCPWLGSDTDEGFTLVQIKGDGEKIEDKNAGKTLRKLWKEIDNIKFKCLLYSVLLGIQVTIRGPEELTDSILKALSVLLPKKWSSVVPYSSEYLKPEACTLLGLSLNVAVPQPCQETLRIDIVDNIYHVRWLGSLPEKLPTLLTKILKSIENELLNDEVLQIQIGIFVEEWSNNAQTIFWVQENNSNEKMHCFLQSMGVQSYDIPLMKHWVHQISLFSK